MGLVRPEVSKSHRSHPPKGGDRETTSETPRWEQRVGDGTARPLTPPCWQGVAFGSFCHDGKEIEEGGKPLTIPTQMQAVACTVGRHHAPSTRMTTLERPTTERRTA